MNDKIRKLKRWADENGAEFVVETEETRFGEKKKYKAVFSRFSEPRWDYEKEAMVRRPKEYVETNKHFDALEVRGGEILDITVESWTDPGEQDYQKEKPRTTGTVGGHAHVNHFGSFSVIETADDGWRRQITVEVDVDKMAGEAVTA